MKTHEEKLREIISSVKGTEESEYTYFHKKKALVPSRKEVIAVLKNLQSLKLLLQLILLKLQLQFLILMLLLIVVWNEICI